MPRKDKEDSQRKKAKDKSKKTFDKYGKNTSRGLRHITAASENAKAKQNNIRQKPPK